MWASTRIWHAPSSNAACAASRSRAAPAFTANRYPRLSITGSTYASLPFFVESTNVDASGTSTSANAGFGLFTVRAQSHAITDK